MFRIFWTIFPVATFSIKYSHKRDSKKFDHDIDIGSRFCQRKMRKSATTSNAGLVIKFQHASEHVTQYNTCYGRSHIWEEPHFL